MSPSSTSDTWIVIPAYNEGPRLRDTLSGLESYFPNVVAVDDGSADETRAIALAYDIWVLRHIVNCGQGAALQTGIDFALERGAEIIVTFDADGQHSVDDLPRLVEPIRSGCVAVALGSRFLGRSPGLPWSRWLVLKLGVLFTRLFSRIAVSDTHNGLRAFSRRAAQRIRITQNRMAHASEILDQIHQEALPFCEVPVTIRYSAGTLEKGQSSWNAVKMAGQLLLERFLR
jgi:glycosyltransferase involved in cell wall biosynthesis